MNDNYVHRFNIFPTLVYIVDCSDLIEPVKDLLKSVTWNDDWNGQSEDVHILNSEPKLVEAPEKSFDLEDICAWISIPMTNSHCPDNPSIIFGSGALHEIVIF